MKTFQTFQEDVSAATQFRKGQKAIERIEAPFTQRKRREEEWRKRVRRMRQSQQRESYEIQMEQVPFFADRRHFKNRTLGNTGPSILLVD